jgi:FtsH-binding integral membrane protein
MISLLLIIICILVLIYGIYENVNKQLTVNRYIITNYMYIFVGLLLYLLTNTTLELNSFNFLIIGNKLLPLFILTTVLLFGLMLTPSDNQSIKHLLWVGFIILMSIVGHPIYMLAKEEKIFYKVLITLAILFIGMSYIAYSNKLTIFDGIAPYLLFGLIGLIIFQSLDLLFSDSSSKGLETRFWYYSIFGIILFSGFLIYDTQKIIKVGGLLEKYCKNKNHLSCADYPEKSLSIFLDLLNLFNNLTLVNRNS